MGYVLIIFSVVLFSIVILLFFLLLMNMWLVWVGMVILRYRVKVGMVVVVFIFGFRSCIVFWDG